MFIYGTGRIKISYALKNASNYYGVRSRDKITDIMNNSRSNNGIGPYIIPILCVFCY